MQLVLSPPGGELEILLQLPATELEFCSTILQRCYPELYVKLKRATSSAHLCIKTLDMRIASAPWSFITAAKQWIRFRKAHLSRG